MYVMASGLVIQQHARDFSGSGSGSKFESKSESTDEITLNPLLNLLTNTLVLHQTIPYLPISSLLNLSATSPSFRDLLLRRTPGVFRHLDLTRVKTAQFELDGGIDHGGEVWRNVQVDENLTEDDFYSGPLRGIIQNIRRRDILHHVQTLVLDGLSVTAEFCNDILVDPTLRVRILSIRDVKNLNERKLMQSLRYVCRSTRPDDTPRLKGLYVFGARDSPDLIASSSPVEGRNETARGGSNISIGWNHKSQHALKESFRAEGDDWYHKRGRIIGRHITDGWAETLLDCRDMIRFDAVLCTGPRHQNSSAFRKMPVVPGGTAPGVEGLWGVATFALGGCASCGSSPEGFTEYGDSPAEHLPLLAPIPLHSSTIKAATHPNPTPNSGPGISKEVHKFIPRCLECIRERYCFSCDQWWCESCYQVPSRQELGDQHVHIVDQTNGLLDYELAALEPSNVKKPKISRSCWECEHNCLDCIANTQKRCRGCGGGYCIVHYEGSTLTFCDWCSRRRGRRSREMY
ncbi:uncharacterized protein GGS22DRAFT_176219 [Annulohypoxylon maeteangense]|uniref:uncharacterized protein n=1 Tax=Annulohypoxylon maeteangense TaxID=1927788 RepID=UPI0020086AB7|nr:uncharacterized protein GGS22DRAFT_176219 [Annulohypoxylon maeteangense]KAI0880014.1 hypothetical protein GGS22DRAFT_176219 [Annulohypoxylon maeteangense]